MSEYIATHTFQYTVKPSNGNVFLQRGFMAQSTNSSYSTIYNVRLFGKIVLYKTWQQEGHHSIEVHGADHTYP